MIFNISGQNFVSEADENGILQEFQSNFQSEFLSTKSLAYQRTLNYIHFNLQLSLTKTGDKVDYQHARNRTFLEKIGDRIVNGFQKVQNTVMDVIDPIMETGESFLGIEDDQNTLQVRILEY